MAEPEEPREETTEPFVLAARRATASNVRIVAWMCIAGALVPWPLDLLFYKDPYVIWGFVIWRTSMAMGCGLGLVALRSVGPTSQLLIPLIALISSILAATAGYGLAIARGLEHGYFHAAYVAPFATAIVLMPLSARIAWAGSTTALFALSYFITSPRELDLAHAGSALVMLGSACAMSTLIGHVLYVQFETNHRQRIELVQSARRERERARELEELDSLKNDLFANLSHELRTPLTLILGHLRGLARELDPMRIHEIPLESALARIETAERNAARLLVLIEDLLELAQLNSGRAQARKRPIDLSALVRDVASNFRPSSPESGAITVDVQEGLAIEADPRQVRTALFNLLSNAYKFTEPDRRRIEVSAARSGDIMSMSVRDNGPGIPSAHLSRIFERFYRVERGYAREHGGTGIGLALVKEIADTHGGTIEVETRVGEGSCFTLRLPVGEIGDTRASLPSGSEIDQLASLHRLSRRASAREAEPRGQPGATTVLVAEDDHDLRRYVASVIGLEHRVRTAEDGSQALAAALASPPDAVVTDVMMPGTSGLDLARALRADPRTRRVPILFLTARAGGGARAEAYSLGADDFLTKPFDEAELLARVKNLIALRRSEAELAASNARLEERVRERTEQLRALAQHQELAAEEERRRIARELHDETGQLLMGLRMELDLAREAARGDPRLEDSLSRMGTLLDQTFAATRTLVSELRPRVLDDLGLGAAVEWYLQRLSERSAIECSWDIEPPDLAVDPASSTAVYRVLQEALTNVLRHSGATRVDVALRASDGRVTLRVADDGVGMTESRSGAGMGLLGMRERAEALGGTLAIEPRAPHGLELTLDLPAPILEMEAAS